jgi:TRAP-type transport system periplasmic protein
MRCVKRILLFCVCVSFVGFSLFIDPALGAPIKLSYSTQFPGTHQHTVLAVEWGKEIQKRTNNAVEIRMYPASTLTPADQCYDGVLRGISDIGMTVFGYSRGRFPLSEVIDLPLAYKSGVAATTLINRFYAQFKPKEFDESVPMYFHAHGPSIMHTKKAVYKLEDFKGMKIRCGGLITKIVNALGGVPVSMPMSECYDALSKGIAEGSTGPYETLYGWKHAEVIKFTTESWGSSSSSGFAVVMNKEKWNSLPPDVKKVIQQVNSEWPEKTGRVWDQIDKEGKDFTLKLGNKIITLSNEENGRWAKAVRPILDDYAKAMNAKGLPGDEALRWALDELKKIQQ